MLLFCDSETYSEKSLPKTGGLEYARHPSTDVLCWSFFAPGWRAGKVVVGIPSLERALARALPDRPGKTILAHWGAFDRFIAERFAASGDWIATRRPRLDAEWPQVIWYGAAFGLLDLRQLCLQAGGPAKVEHASVWAGAEKLSRIAVFSEPQQGRRLRPEERPETWQKLLVYAARDAEVLYKIAQRIGSAAPGRAENAEGWRVVERMNARGFPVDKESVRLARRIVAREEPKLVAEFERLSGGIRPTQVQKIAALLGTPDCKKDTLAELLARPKLDRRVRRLAEIRLETAGATRHKLSPLLSFLSSDDRCRYQFTYFGAWTRRLTAQGTQPQNFHRLSDEHAETREAFFEELRDWQRGPEIFEAVKQQIRGFIRAPEGRTLISADFSRIELHCMAWAADERWLLEALRAGTDVYRITAGNLYGSSPKAISYEQRAFGKMVELASQFGLSATGRHGTGGLRAKAKQEGIEMTIAEAERAIRIYKKTHPKIVGFWEQMQEGFRKCMVTGRTMKVGAYTFEHTQRDLIRLIRPSGHFQCFWRPAFVDGDYTDQLSYVGRLKNGAMGRVMTYGSRLAQGAIQGTAGDIMLDAMKRAEDAGFLPVMSIHDEVVAEIPDDGRDRTDEFCRVLATGGAEWTKGIPIVAEGWQDRRFR